MGLEQFKNRVNELNTDLKKTDIQINGLELDSKRIDIRIKELSANRNRILGATTMLNSIIQEEEKINEESKDANKE